MRAKSITDYEGIEPLTDTDIKNLKEAFEAIDDDGNKTLDKEELQIFMNECNFDIKYTDLIMKIVDKSNHGYIDINEFLTFIQVLKSVEKNPNILLKMLFDAIDQDEDGRLNPKEASEFVNFFCPKITEIEVDSFLKDFSSSPNKDFMTYNDILKVIK